MTSRVLAFEVTIAVDDYTKGDREILTEELYQLIQHRTRNMGWGTAGSVREDIEVYEVDWEDED